MPAAKSCFTLWPGKLWHTSTTAVSLNLPIGKMGMKTVLPWCHDKQKAFRIDLQQSKHYMSTSNYN